MIKDFFNNLIYRSSIYTDKVSELNNEIYELNNKIAYQESVLNSMLPFYTFEKSKVPLNFEQSQEIWMRWGIKMHQASYQIERQLRAVSGIYTPLSFDASKGTGIFRGKQCDYNTSLQSCECMDFQRRLMPCKHMYRLAYELDVYMLEDVEVITNIKDLMQMSDVTPIIKALSLSKKELLLDIIDDPFLVKRSEIRVLLDTKLVQICSNKELMLMEYTKEDLFALLPDDHNKKITKSMKKSLLVSSILEFYPEIISNLEKLYVFAEPNKLISHLIPEIRKLL